MNFIIFFLFLLKHLKQFELFVSLNSRLKIEFRLHISRYSNIQDYVDNITTYPFHLAFLHERHFVIP